MLDVMAIARAAGFLRHHELTAAEKDIQSQRIYAPQYSTAGAAASCARKVSHPTRGEAVLVANRMVRNGRVDHAPKVYQCHICSQYHLTKGETEEYHHGHY